MNERNFDDIKNILEEPEIPERLSPENIKAMLDENSSSAVQKKKISMNSPAMKWAAGAAACAVLAGVGTFAARNLAKPEILVSGGGRNYTVSASEYAQVYRYMDKTYEQMQEEVCYDEVEETAVEEEAAAEEEYIGSDGTNSVGNGSSIKTETTEAENEEHSDVYNQENGVLEGDIVRTDGRRIFSAETGYDEMNIHITELKDGRFTGNQTCSLYSYLPKECSGGSVESMYIEDGRLIAAASVNEKTQGKNYSYRNRTHILVFDTENMELLGDYSQDGYFTDIRLMEDGTLYLVSRYGWLSEYRYQSKSNENCIPQYGADGEYAAVSPEAIMLPDDSDESYAHCSYTTSFTNIGSINVLSDNPDKSIDFISLAGFAGSMYCSPENIYIASGSWNYDTNCTDFTRISIDKGEITPCASVTEKGTVKDQFSMSEYNGYFRAAVSVGNSWGPSENYNAVYVFDMDMKKTGEVSGFGQGESVKSASFSGNKAYVVTFRQTDPLYSIDLSDPANPVILDEHKITGYSSYMQKWSDGLLLGFGIDADEGGAREGLKLVMFDNSDPENLKECGIMYISGDEYNQNTQHSTYGYSWISSPAESERKAMLIAPEKNLIAVPFTSSKEMWDDDYYDINEDSGVGVYSYENGIFRTEKIFFTREKIERVLYIGNSLVFIGSHEAAAADMTTMNETDHIYF